MDQLFTEKVKLEIQKALEDKGALNPCPRCQKTDTLFLLDGYFVHTFQNDLNELRLGGQPVLPFVIVACSNCGFLSQHALGGLGLMPREGQASEKSKENESDASNDSKKE